jgi:hypothetical protein
MNDELQKPYESADFTLNDTARVLSSLCIGYATAHVLVIYVFLKLILGTLGLDLSDKAETGLGALQLTAMILFSYVFPRVVNGEGRSSFTPTWFKVGVVMFVAAALINLWRVPFLLR